MVYKSVFSERIFNVYFIGTFKIKIEFCSQLIVNNIYNNCLNWGKRVSLW